MDAVTIFKLTLVLLATVIVLHWIAARVGLPPSATLLVAGGGLALIPGMPTVRLDPELALVLFLPPLLMNGAYFTAFGRFRRHLSGILSLAVGAVLFTTLVVAIIAHWLIPPLPWAACFALGAVVSPPDAIAARAVLQRVQIPRRLQALLEGESLLNDATGLVLFRFAVAATLTGVFNTGAAIESFALLAAGGVAVGVAVGACWVFLLCRLTDETLNVAAGALTCWTAYLGGEALHVSGVIATVTAGIIFGWWQHVILPARVRLQAGAFWRTLVFVLEAMVFILMGFSLRDVLGRAGGLGEVVTTLAVPIAGVLAALIAARFIWVFGSDALLTALNGRLRFARPLGWRQASILGWAGMRGVVTLAIALALPEEMPGRDLMLVTAFAVILFTVVVQGSLLGWLIGLVRPVDIDPPAPVSLARAEAVVARAMLIIAEQRAYAPDGRLIHPRLLDKYQQRATSSERYADEPNAFMADIRPHFDVMLEAIAAGRAELIRLQRQGQIEDEVLHDLERDLDIEEMSVSFQRGEGYTRPWLFSIRCWARPTVVSPFFILSGNSHSLCSNRIRAWRSRDYPMFSAPLLLKPRHLRCVRGPQDRHHPRRRRHLAALPRSFHAQRPSARAQGLEHHGGSCDPAGLPPARPRGRNADLAPRRRPAARPLVGTRCLHAQRRARRARLHDLFRAAPRQAAQHQPAGTAQQGGEAPRRRRRHLPQRGQHHPSHRRRTPRAERRVPAPEPLHADRGHGRSRHTTDRAGNAATDYTQGHLNDAARGHTRNYTTLTDTTVIAEGPNAASRLLHRAWCSPVR